MNILFLGKFYPKGILETIVTDTRGKAQFSNHNFEMSLIRGLCRQPGVELRALTAPNVYSYPHNNRKPFIRKIRHEEEGVPVRSIGFCNLAVVNKLFIIRNLTRAIKEELDRFEGNDVTVIVNTPTIELSAALFRAIRRSKKNVRTTLIIPDLPQCLAVTTEKNKFKIKLLNWIDRYNSRLCGQYDGYVYLTEAMNDIYHADREGYIVMEGLMDESRFRDAYRTPEYRSGKEIILYTGTLRRIYGVMSLLDAFEKADLENTELWICGSGECAPLIQERAKANPDIKFLGMVSSEEALRLQGEATILANPRSAEGEYTKYSFPSKTIEYLMAGRTVIMNRLPGVPSEYDRFICYPDDESTESWASKLRQITIMDPEQRLRMSEAGRQFILDNKTATHQCARILDLCRRNH